MSPGSGTKCLSAVTAYGPPHRTRRRCADRWKDKWVASGGGGAGAAIGFPEGRRNIWHAPRTLAPVVSVTGDWRAACYERINKRVTCAAASRRTRHEGHFRHSTPGRARGTRADAGSAPVGGAGTAQQRRQKVARLCGAGDIARRGREGRPPAACLTVLTP